MFVVRFSRVSLLLFLLVFSILAYADESAFQFIRAVGDERENYFFTKNGGIAISDKKEIFIVDKKKFSIVKYNGDGAFITRTGKQGRGPGDFLRPSGIQYFGKKLYINDWMNRRLALTGLKMTHFDYIKILDLTDLDGRIYTMRSAPIVLDENRFLGINQEYSTEKGRLFTFDKNQKVNTYFFCDLPTDLNDEKWRIKADNDKRFLFNFFTYPVVGVNHEKKTMLITFETPDIEMRFYLYRFSGELIRQFTYRQNEKFRFPMQQLDSMKNQPPHSTMVLDVLSCHDYYLVFMAQTVNRLRPDKKNIFTYLFINEQGEIIHRQEERVRYRTATPDGYLAGIKWDKENDLLKIIISKLDTNYLSIQKPISSKSP